VRHGEQQHVIQEQPETFCKQHCQTRGEHPAAKICSSFVVSNETRVMLHSVDAHGGLAVR
jgi:hypothetical protein